jgi:hypothetical protein
MSATWNASSTGKPPGIGDLGGKPRRFGQRDPDPKCHASNFKPTKDIKLVPHDPTDPNGKALSISATLDPK